MLKDVIASILRDIGAGRILKEEGLRICLQLRDAASGEAQPFAGEEAIAIIGVAGRYPCAENLAEFWENLKAGRDCISELPRERWHQEKYMAANGAAIYGGFIDNVDKFDAPFFNVSPREAESIDPQERIFLEVAWATLEDAGYTRRMLQEVGSNDMPGNVGVFVGATYQEYQLFSAEQQMRGKTMALPGISAGIANRVSYFCNFHGPSMAVDTMCSSSLTAVHLACQSLLTGQCEMALAGGVNLSLHPNKFLLLGQGNFVSEKGRCASFGADADGYVPGEGAGAVLLKPLSRALKDRDRIYAVIRGMAVNHGGKTNGYTVPNPIAQAAVIKGAMARSKIAPREVSYIEAHGTGTLLGDPIEISSLSKAYEVAGSSALCAIGSVKSNIGHCEAAAGIAGLSKVLLQMKHGQLVPSLHADKLNPNIDFTTTPFKVQRELTAWQSESGNRIAGVSSFGAGGSNAHILIEEWKEPAKVASKTVAQGRHELIVLSAQSEDRLRDLAANLKNHLDHDLSDVAYTLQVGREAMECRVAFLVSNAEELIAHIDDWLTGSVQLETTFAGHGQRDLPTRAIPQVDGSIARHREDCLKHRRLEELGRLWADGLFIDWRDIHSEVQPQRVALPAYPFDRSQGYWFDSYEKKQEPAITQEAANKMSVSSAIERPTIPVALSIVSCRLIDDCIAIVRMEDREHRNQLAGALVSELQSIFVAIANDPRIKVVVLTGYDDIFCMGGTKETLEGVSDGKLRYSDVPFVYRGLVDCPVPVIAAMEGHAVGGGLALGCQADIIYLAEESVYCANFMQYGFTPGMGGTLFFLEKFGSNLAHEMMFTADSISGKALKEKGAPLDIKPRAQVLPEAILKARSLAEKPIDALKLLKSTLSKRVLENLPRVVDEELAMHEETIKRPDVRRTIETRIDHMEALSISAPPPSKDANRSAEVSELKIDVSSIQTQLQNIVAKLLHMQPHQVRSESTFQDMGVDSIVAVELARDVNATFGLTLDAVVLYDCPTVRKYAQHIAEELDKLTTSLASARSETLRNNEQSPQPMTAKKLSLSELGSSSATAHADSEAIIERRKIGLSLPNDVVVPPKIERPTPPEKKGSIAVIGMAGRFPGAKDIQTFWANLAAGICSVQEVPAARWSIDDVYDPDPLKANKTYSRVGGFLDDVDKFDPLFFNLSPAEAEQMDPQQRLFLQTAWHAFEDAGYAADELAGRSCGVFVGVGQGDYLDVLKASGHVPGAQSLMGNTCSMLAARIAYLMDLKGPNMAIDTACSSSLVAIHQACKSILAGESELALAGGVYVMTTPMMHVMTSKGAMLSTKGQCRTFDQDADGFVLAEGVGALILKDLDQAIRDGDHIYGVIRGSGINHDGATNGITAPSAASQESLIAGIYEKFDIKPDAIGMVEAHGTGTKLGDPIEVKALTKAFRSQTDKVGYCAIGSVKSNIGHGLAAAGVAGAIKTLLCLHHRKLVPTIHFKRPNEHINLETSPFYIVAEYRDWAPNAGHMLRQAALSSFGLSGTNAHAVFEEYVAAQEEQEREPNGYHLITLSAKSENSLRQRMDDIAEWVARNAATTRLQDVAFTLNLGRSHFDHRCAFVAQSIAEIENRLRSALREPQASVFVGRAQQIKPEDDAIFRMVLQRGVESLQQLDRNSNAALDELRALGALYIKGYALPWNKLLGSAHHSRISLPGYPFAQERCWASPSLQSASKCEQRLHPLIGSNISDLSHLQYATRFTGGEFYLNDHRIHGVRILPGAAILEMARAAAALASKQDVLKIRDVVWVRPVAVETEPQTVVMHLRADGGEIGFNLGQEDEVSVEYCARGVIEPGLPQPSRPTPLDLPAIISRCADTKKGVECYELFASLGIEYGPSFRTIKTLRFSKHEALAELQALPAGDVADFWLNPALLDGAFQAGLGIMLGNSENLSEPAVPYSLGELTIHARMPDHVYAYVTRSDGVWNIAITDKSGRALVELRDLRSRILPSEDNSLLTLTSRWVDGALPSPQATAASSCTLVFTANNERLAQSLASTRFATDLLRLPSDEAEAGIMAAFDNIKQRLQMPLRGSHQYVVLTSPDDDPCQIAALSGLLKTASLENPGIRSKIIHRSSDEGIMNAEIDALPDNVDEVRWNPLTHRREIKSFESIDLSSQNSASPLREGGVYWITGGAGGLGLLTARHIAKTGTGNVKIALSGRSELSERQRSALRELEQAGAQVLYLRCDVSLRDDVNATLKIIKAKLGELNGIIHSAGVIRDAFILKKSREQVGEVLSPKVAGVMNLLHATAGDQLDFLILYSAAAGSLGNLGQCDYSAANAFLDAIALKHRDRKVVSLGWPLWANGGMTVDSQTEQMMRAVKGVEPMPVAVGLKLLDAACAANHPHLLVLYGRKEKLKRTLFDQPKLMHVEDELVQSGVAEVTEADVIDYVKKQLATPLKLSTDRIDAEKPFEEYGIDSVMVLEVTARFEKDWGPLPKTLFFEHANVRALSRHFMTVYPQKLALIIGKTNEAAGKAWAPLQSPAAQPTNATRAGSLDIAIVGLAGRYPKAPDLETFWNNLKAGLDCISEIPADRWDHNQYYDAHANGNGKVRSKWGGFLDDVDKFDPAFFKISPLEAEIMDPQERLFLEVAWEAMEDAGYARDMQQRKCCGVYVGLMYSEYQLYGADEQSRGHQVALSGSSASVANRVSYQLNLSGPSITVDSMCSSSFTAIYLACQSLRSGQTEMALAGGVNLSIHPNKYLLLGQGQFVSSTGRCESFGLGGDGYVPGEGIGCIVLKTLEAAQADGDHIYGVIRGMAVNHGGKTNGYTVPNPVAQHEVIEAALSNANVSPRHVSYVEAHGTGTSLGDPVEIEGLTRAFHAASPENGFCAIGSVKSNIGHCESAAGMAGLTKVLLQMKHRQLVPSLHSATLNPHIDFKKTPFIVQQEVAEWRRLVATDAREIPRIAGISSFGAGGSNAHMIVEEWAAAAKRSPDIDGPVVIVLSARTSEQLQKIAGNFQKYFAEIAQTKSANLQSIAYTLQVGREAMERRLAFVATNAEEAASSLWIWINGQVIVRDRYPSLQAIADDWMAGSLPDWTGLYPNGTPARVSLPTYPFVRERYWVPRTKEETAERRAPVHTPPQDATSKQHVFEYRFSDEEAWLNEHQVHGESILPAVGFLNLILWSGRDLAPSRHVSLRDVVWLQPLVVKINEIVRVAFDTDEDGFVSEVTSDAGIHCRGTLVAAVEKPPEDYVDIESLKASLPQTGSVDSMHLFYEVFAQAGIAYGVCYQNIRQFWADETHCVASIERGSSADERNDSTREHAFFPPLMDAALQAIGCLRQKRGGITKLPFSLGLCELYGRLPSAFYAYVVETFEDRYDIILLQADGRVIGRLTKLELRALSDPLAGLKWSVQWQSEELPTGQSDGQLAKSGRTLVIGHEHAFDLEKSIATYQNEEPISRLSLHAGEQIPLDVSKVYFLGGLDDRVFDCLDPSVIIERHCSSTENFFLSVKGLLETHRNLEIIVLAQQTQTVFENEAIDPGSSGLIGFCQSLAKECPAWTIKLVDIDLATLRNRGGHRNLLQRLAREPKHSGFGCVAYRGTERLISRVAPLVLPERPVECAIREGGTYVIAGGAGGIGFTISEALVKQFKARVIWLGRRPFGDVIRSQIELLKGDAPEPLYVQVDITDRGRMAEVLDILKRDGTKIHGVIHSALSLNDQGLRSMSEAQFKETAGAKVLGSVTLAETFGREAQDFLCFFSSAQSLMGGPGQANYAAGSSFEDAYAQALRKRFDCAVHVINWGFWGEVGAGARDDYRERMNRLGIGSITRAQGVQAFLRVLASGTERALVLKASAGVMNELGWPEVRPNAPSTFSSASSFVALTAELDFIRQLVADTLKIPAHDIKANTSFEEIGVDSIIAAVLTDRLEKAFGRLPRTLVFEYRTVAQLKDYFNEHHTVRLRELIGGFSGKTAVAPLTEMDYPPELVLVQPSGTKPISFWVHGLVGFAHVYRNLSQALGPDYPIYGLQARGVDGQDPPHGTIEEMAAHYVQAIRKVQPQGPYYLGGYSSGGVIALEMAQQLAAVGEVIGCVFLLDTYPTTERVTQALEEKMNYAMRSAMTANLFLTGVGNDGVRLHADQLDGVLPDQHVLHLLKLIEASGGARIPSSEIYRMLRGSIDVQNSMGAALKSYHPRAYEASDVVFFQSTKKFIDEGNALSLPVTELDTGNREAAWRDRIKSQLEVVNIASDHFGLLEKPFIESLRRNISNILDGSKISAPSFVGKERSASKALVVGGGFSGLLSARVLADHFDTVTVLERDVLDDEAMQRKGVPQGNHLHNLLKGGLNILCDLFPGFEQDLIRMGSVAFRIGYDLRQEDEFGLWPQRDFGLTQYCQTRGLLERCIRNRLRAFPNVRIEDDVTTKELLWSQDGRRVIGLNVADREGYESPRHADLIVNATGRRQTMLLETSKRGWPVPEETSISVDLGYSTCLFEIPPDMRRSWKGVYSYGVGPDGEKSRCGGSILPVENDRWIVTLGGRAGEFPPTDMQGFLDFARKLPTDTISNAIAQARPVTGKVEQFRFPASVMRHFDRLEHRPERLLHVGDVFCCFDPVLGQGMTSAALQIMVLDGLLSERRNQPDALDGLEQAFFRRAADVVRTPWRFAAQSSLERNAEQEVEYQKFCRIAEQAKSDANLHKALIEMFQLINAYEELDVQKETALKVAQ